MALILNEVIRASFQALYDGYYLKLNWRRFKWLNQQTSEGYHQGGVRDKAIWWASIIKNILEGERESYLWLNQKWAEKRGQEDGTKVKKCPVDIKYAIVDIS